MAGIVKKNSVLKSLTTVTAFSKFVALVLFITLPFVGFYLGTEYGKLKSLVSVYQPVETSKVLKSTDYSNCFNSSNDSTLLSVTSVCPIYFLKNLENSPVGDIFRKDNEVYIFQAGIVYVFHPNKPVYDFVTYDKDASNVGIDKDFILNETRIVDLGNMRISAWVVSSKSCTTKSDESCIEKEKHLLMRLPEGVWMEVVGQNIDSYVKKGADEILYMVQIVGKDDGVDRFRY